jgi:antitoxin (DNA-binding transcriptional repressor) of toxin-antitoxin stability system
METISVADAKSRFSELISRTSAGERFMIRRRERSMAVLINPIELEKMERASQTARRLALALGQDEALLGQIDRHETHPAMVAFGLWNDPSLDNFIDEVYESRQIAPNRPEVDL